MTCRIFVALLIVLGGGAPAFAQEPPPRLPFVAVDLHGAFVNFPVEQALSDSRGLQLGQLPGAAIGGDLSLNIYPLRWRAVTFGLGGRVMAARARQVPVSADGQTPALPAVTERFVTGAPEISFNFGSGNGWSYISGGVGRSAWQVIQDGTGPQDADDERLYTSNYGGGARWFIKKHLAFSFDVRIYGIKAGTVGVNDHTGPRTSLLVIGAGVSVK